MSNDESPNEEAASSEDEEPNEFSNENQDDSELSDEDTDEDTPVAEAKGKRLLPSVQLRFETLLV